MDDGCFRPSGTIDLLQGLLQTLPEWMQAPGDQLPDAAPVAVDGVARGTAAVVAVQRGGALQAHGQVAGLTEETQLLARVQGAEDGAAEAAAGTQLGQTLNGVSRRSLLAPAGQRGQRGQRGQMHTRQDVRVKIQF